jgi:hypothetical protein
MSLRADRTEHSRSKRLRQSLRSRVASVVPERARKRVRTIERRNTPHLPHELRRLRHHYDYWRGKWGFDMLNPDMEQFCARYGETELCWAYDPVRRAAGEEIAAAWAAADVSSA